MLNGIVYWIALSTNYSVAFAPAIAVLVGIAGRELWRDRNQFRARITLAVMVAVNGCWDYVLLSREASWVPALHYVVFIVSILAAVASPHRRQASLARSDLRPSGLG